MFMGFLVTLKRWFGLSSSATPELKAGDKLLVCEDCGNKFVFDVGEQIFFKEKGFTEPKRCPTCRKKVRRRLRRRGRGGSKPEGNQQSHQHQHSNNNHGGNKRHRNDNNNHRQRRHSAIDGDSPYADER
jgi:hypothetical protein